MAFPFLKKYSGILVKFRYSRKSQVDLDITSKPDIPLTVASGNLFIFNFVNAKRPLIPLVPLRIVHRYKNLLGQLWSTFSPVSDTGIPVAWD